MVEKIYDNVIDESFALSTGETNNDPDSSPISEILSQVVRTGDLLPPWWSRARDNRLAQTWKRNNHIALAVYNAQAKLVGIPFRIEARDPSNPKHAVEAEMITSLINFTSGFGEGWIVTFGRFVEDLLTQDNGAFMEIIGDGSADGPILGRPVSLRHLDASRCQRTSSIDYPVIYTDDDGVRWKLHRSRVITMSQMTSPKREMNGVGFCAVSRAVEIGQTLYDMVRYKQQRLGSRPASQILVGKGLTGKQIMQALRAINFQLDDEFLSHYAKTMAIGSEDTDIDLKKIDLNHMEPFKEETNTNLGMLAISAAFGMDVDEIWPIAGTSSGSQGDSNLRRMRSRGRLPAQLTQDVANQMDFKFLPPYLKWVFDFKDDMEDQQQALIKDIRARNRERDLGDGTLNIRATRQRMVQEGDMDRRAFEEVELSDGRLPDGKTLGILFFSSDPVYQRWLNFHPNPLIINDNPPEEMISDIQKQREGLLREWANTTSKAKEVKLNNAYFALDWLEQQYAIAGGFVLPNVPVQARRMRTDIRVDTAPDPEGGEVAGQQDVTPTAAQTQRTDIQAEPEFQQTTRNTNPRSTREENSDRIGGQ